VTKETGFKIPSTTPEESIQGLANAMVKLTKDPDLGRHMGKAGKMLVQSSHSWQFKGDELSRLYNNLFKSRIAS
jgi:glycosyltransferase involved in cell wall biosynthesis